MTRIQLDQQFRLSRDVLLMLWLYRNAGRIAEDIFCIVLGAWLWSVILP